MGLWILAAIIGIVLLGTVFTYNGLVRRRNMVAEAWSGIEAQLKRRADLIPNLVETVKGYATHERATLDELTRLRGAGGTSSDVAARAETEKQISAMIGRVMAVAEAYPDLKASANFQSLQHDLAGVEDQIQLARRYYNGATRDYNVMVESFPSNVIAGGFGFAKSAYFEIDNAADRAVPKVAFFLNRLPIGAWAMLLALLLLAAPARAQDAERITHFSSDITVYANGTLAVRETIDVVSAGIEIRRGIFRDFPTTYSDRAGNRVRVRFDVRGVTRDGREEPYALETLSNGRRVRIGDADVLIAPGPHRYVIEYETDRQIGFFPDTDELYWNVTGNGWTFAIEEAEAEIHFPPGATIRQFAFYTGPQGSRGNAAEAVRLGDTDMRFRTTAPLGREEGLTIAVGFAKGIIAPPNNTEKTASFLRDNAPVAAALAGLVALFGFYFYVWWRLGRDPQRGTVIALFEPPQALSAPAMRFIRRMGFDNKGFAAALIGMAVKSYLTISEEGHVYTLKRTGKSTAEAGLSAAERAAGDALFSGSDTIALKNSNHARVSRAIAGLSAALKREDEGVYFVTNRGWFVAGLAILVASAGTAALFSDAPEDTAFVLFWAGGWTAGTLWLLHKSAGAWASVFHGPGSRVFNFIGAVFSSLFALPFLGGLVIGAFFIKDALPLVAVGALIAQGILAYVFFHLLKAPTAAGAKIRDAIEGFRLFLVTAEKDRLEMLHPPDVTPELFEKLLPYAIALDAENEWSQKFEAEALRAGTTPAAYRPGWYSGPSYSRLGTGGFAAAIGASVASAASAASTAPGRSSGSGGGGFSGGGGGGGGGGGW